MRNQLGHVVNVCPQGRLLISQAPGEVPGDVRNKGRLPIDQKLGAAFYWSGTRQLFLLVRDQEKLPVGQEPGNASYWSGTRHNHSVSLGDVGLSNA